MSTIKERYKLGYANSDFISGLTKWYNRLLDKTIKELTTEDVIKMVRQNILKDVALEKATELFIENPYAGEFEDGELLSLITSLEYKTYNAENTEKVKGLISALELSHIDFDWCTIAEKEKYSENLKSLKDIYF